MSHVTRPLDKRFPYTDITSTDKTFSVANSTSIASLGCYKAAGRVRHCSCMAGLRKACYHIAALFAAETNTQLKTLGQFAFTPLPCSCTVNNFIMNVTGNW